MRGDSSNGSERLSLDAVTVLPAADSNTCWRLWFSCVTSLCQRIIFYHLRKQIFCGHGAQFYRSESLEVSPLSGSLFYIPFKSSSLCFLCRKQNKSRLGIYCTSTSCNPCLFTPLPPLVLRSLINGLQRRTEPVLEIWQAARWEQQASEHTGINKCVLFMCEPWRLILHNSMYPHCLDCDWCF